MKRLALLLVFVLSSLNANAQKDKDKGPAKPKINAELLLGKWQSLTPGKTGFYEFRKDGTATISYRMDGENYSIPATYTLKDDKLVIEFFTLKNAWGIKKLTETQLIIKDPCGPLSEFKKVK